MRFLPGSLRGRLMLLIALAALPGFVLLAINTAQEKQRAVKAAEETLERVARNVALKGRERIVDSWRLLDMIAAFPSVKAQDAARCSMILAGVHRAFDLYENLGVAGLDGKLWCSALPPRRPTSVADRDWFQSALSRHDSAIGSHQLGRVSGRHSVNFALPVRDGKGKPAGVAFAALGAAWFTHITQEVQLPPGAILVITDKNGRLISRRPAMDELIGKAVTPGMLEPIIQNGCSGRTHAVSLDGITRHFAYASFDKERSDAPCVLVGLSMETLLAPIEADFRQGLQLDIAATLLVLLLAWFSADVLVLRRLGRLGQAMERFGNGDPLARTALDGTDEIGRLGRHFDDMAEQLAAKNRQLARANRALTALSRANQAIVGADGEAGLLADICRAVVEGGGYRMAWVGYADGASGMVRPVVAAGHVEGYLNAIHIRTSADVPEGRGPIGTALRSGQTMVCRNIAEDPAFSPWREAALERGYASMIALPLKRDGQVFGSLNIYAAEADAFDEREVALLTEISHDLAYGLETQSARIARRAAEEANRLKTEFMANMSHELRTPLTAIIGFSEILRDGMAGPLTPQQQDYAGEILASGQHLLELINDILDLTKVEAGRMQLELAPADIPGVLASCLAIVREKAMAHRITLQLDIDPTVGGMALDERKFKQMTYNLLSNAVKFTPDGGSVKLSAHRVPREAVPHAKLPVKYGHYLEVSVTDTGPGISAEDQKRLFQSFVQLDSGLARRHEGTGLGLALVKRLAELHGGAVGVESRPGEGAKFSFWLPYRSVEAGTDTIPAEEEGPAPASAPLVLIVEDDPYAARLIRHQLTEGGFRSVIAPTAEAALARLEKQPLPDLITLDILLPGMDGWELLAELKRRPHIGSIPVVIISIVADHDKGLALGAAGVLQKPFTQGELAAALASLALKPGASRLKVLAIDDDPVVLELVRSQLQNKAMEIRCAGSGADGLEMARADPPDLILLDLMMPGMDGFEVAKALRRDERTARIPILVLTAKLLTDEERARLNGHVERIMQKSDFNRGNFLLEVRRALARTGAAD